MLKLLYRFPYPHLAVFMVFIYLYYFSKSHASYYLFPIALFYFPDAEASESLQRKINAIFSAIITFFSVTGRMIVTYLFMYGLSMYIFKL